MKKFNVAFATDHNFIQHLGVTLYSLLDNNKDLDFNIYIINNGINEEQYNKIKTITGKFDSQIIFVISIIIVLKQCVIGSQKVYQNNITNVSVVVE